jgi:hypothetical protein
MAIKLVFTFEVDGVRWDENAEVLHDNTVEIWNEATDQYDWHDFKDLIALPSFRVLRLRSEA